MVMRIYSKLYAERFNLDLLAFIRVNNEPSLKVFRGLGFQEYHLCHWTKIDTADKHQYE